VESGRVVGLAHDRRTAARFSERYGQKIHSTGGAVAGGERYGAFPLNPVISVTGDSRPVEDLLGDLGDGLWVNEFWYTRVLDPRTLVVTGLTRNGLYVVRNGQVVGTAPNLRFTQSYLAALGPGQVVMAGNDLSPTATGVIAPSLAISSWRFTGGARG
jgi:predicted Zn-dependent protease